MCVSELTGNGTSEWLLKLHIFGSSTSKTIESKVRTTYAIYMMVCKNLIFLGILLLSQQKEIIKNLLHVSE